MPGSGARSRFLRVLAACLRPLDLAGPAAVGSSPTCNCACHRAHAGTSYESAARSSPHSRAGIDPRARALRRPARAGAKPAQAVCRSVRPARRPRSDQSAGETCAHIPPVTALPRLASDASPASPCMSLRISSSGFPVTSVPGLRMAPCLTPKPDTLRATEPDISFAPNTRL